MYKERCNKVLKIMEDKELDAILVSNGYNMRYLSGFSGATGYLYVSKNKRVVLTDSRYTVQAKEEAKDFQVMQVERGYLELFSELFEAEDIKSVGFEGQDVLCATFSKWQREFLGIHWEILEEELSELRMIKTPEELEKIRRAEEIGDLAFTRILDVIKPGVTELEVAAYLEFFMKQNGAEGLSFDTIVASGINSAKPHAVPGRKVIAKGDFVTMDFGCIYEGYCSDMTRTIVVGKADQKQKEIYQTVLEAQLAALAVIKAGMAGAEVDKVAREIIEKAGYGNCFGHGLGHSVGLFIHESPRLSPTEKRLIKAGMTETVEPGIYVEGFGGVRIEDLVVVTDKGCENLTYSAKELIEL